MWSARFHNALPRIEADHPKLRWVFVTLTVRNCPVEQLRDTLQAINDGWSRLTKQARWPAQGFVKGVEVTRGADGSAHPHIHALLAVRPSYFSHSYIPQKDWQEMWRMAMRLDYAPVVDIRAVKPGQAALRDALRETLKYTVKPQDLTTDREWFLSVSDALHKTRAISTGGIIKPYLKEDDDTDLIHTDEAIGEGDNPGGIRFGWRDAVAVPRYARKK